MSQSFHASADVFTNLQRTGSRSTLARRLDARLAQPDLRTFLTDPDEPALEQYPVRIATDLAAALWRFEEAGGTVADDSIGSLNGAYSGGVSFRVAGALESNQGTDVDYAVALDGATGQVTIPHSATITDFTSGQSGSVEFWMRTSATLVNVLGKYDGAGYPYLFVLQGDGRLRFERFNGVTTTSVVSASPVNDNAWHYVVGQFDAGVEALLQVDGAALTTADTGGATGNTADLIVGDPTGTAPYEGEIDELALYRYALTVAIRSTHRDVGLGVPV